MSSDRTKRCNEETSLSALSIYRRICRICLAGHCCTKLCRTKYMFSQVLWYIFADFDHSMNCHQHHTSSKPQCSEVPQPNLVVFGYPRPKRNVITPTNDFNVWRTNVVTSNSGTECPSKTRQIWFAHFCLRCLKHKSVLSPECTQLRVLLIIEFQPINCSLINFHVRSLVFKLDVSLYCF